MTTFEKTMNVLQKLQGARHVLMFRNVPKNNPAAKDFKKALEELVLALEAI